MPWAHLGHGMHLFTFVWWTNWKRFNCTGKCTITSQEPTNQGESWNNARVGLTFQLISKLLWVTRRLLTHQTKSNSFILICKVWSFSSYLECVVAQLYNSQEKNPTQHSCVFSIGQWVLLNTKSFRWHKIMHRRLHIRKNQLMQLNRFGNLLRGWCKRRCIIVQKGFLRRVNVTFF